jgi:ParB/RepB/Spo0J family partition protein
LSLSHPSRAATVRLSKIRPGDNPRRYFDPKKHDELVSSLLARGMLQPILLRPAAGADEIYDLVAGERRYRAALQAFGAEGEVPVTIREMTDQEAFEAAIDENDIRDDASETEQADAALRVLAACHGDRAEATRRLGWSRAKLDRRLALAELSETVKRALDERRIKVGHAELLAAVPGDKQDKALETILGSGLDVARTRDLLMRVTQDLGSASFDKSACTTCPFNSASQRTLFETHIDDGHCTNPTCFALKTQAAEMLWFEEQERAEKAARAAAPAPADQADEDIHADGELAPAPGFSTSSDNDHRSVAAAAPERESSSGGSGARKSSVTAKSIAARTIDLREATWRTALARALASHPAHARTTILVAAMTGTLSQIKSETLRARASLLVDAAFPGLDFGAKIAAIRDLAEPQASTAFSAVGAAYARDVTTFGNVADLAHAFGVDVRDIWQVDQPFLERFIKDELRFIAQECGLVAHMGEKSFARLLGSKKSDLIAGMLKPTGFDWAGRLPGAMTLDGQYGAPTSAATAPISDLAA